MKKRFSVILLLFIIPLFVALLNPLTTSGGKVEGINVEINTIDEDGYLVEQLEAGEVTRTEGNAIYGNTDQLVATANEGYEFSFYLERDYVLSINPKHSYRVAEAHQFKAVFRESDKAHVLVVDANNQYLGTLLVDEGTQLDNSDLKIFEDKLKSKPGYDFKGWSVGEAFTASKTTVVKANYTAPNNVYQVEVNINGEVNSHDVSHGRTLTVTTTEENFSYWKVNGVIAAYTKEYTFSVYSDMYVEAVFSEHTTGEVLTLLNQEIIIDDPVFYFLIQSQARTPEHKYDILEQGLIFLYSDSEVNGDIDFNTDNVQRARAIRTSANDEFSIAINAVNSKYLYARSYLVVRTNNQQIQTVYSETKYFKQLEYDINYELNKGTNATANKQRFRYTDLKEGVNLQPASNEGYNFVGWYTDEACVENKVTKLSIDNCTETFYAKYEAIEYALTYDLDEGTLENPIDTFTIEDLGFSLPSPTKAGYKFIGWYDNQDYSGNAITTINKIGDIKLYAKWEIVNYQITYNLDGGKLDDPTYSFTINDLDVVLLEPSKKGYEFKGWFVNADHTGDAITHIAEIGNIALYAKWEVITYTITYHLDGGSLENPITTFTIEDLEIALPIPTKEHNRFLGWDNEPNPSLNPNNSIKSITELRDYDLYANWLKYSIYVRYELDGGENDSRNTIESVDGFSIFTYDNLDYTLQDPTKEGHDFLGWFEEGSENQITTLTIEMIPTEGEDEGFVFITLEARWEEIEYEITYNLDGGTNNFQNKTTVLHSDIEDLNFKLLNPEKHGYDFKGWYLDSEFNEKITHITKDNFDRTFYAKWELRLITITYHLEGGVNNPENKQTITYDDLPYTLLEPTKEGHIFKGWYEIPQTKEGKWHVIGEDYSGNEIIIYAVWEKVTFTVTFTGEEIDIAEQKIDHGDQVTEPPTPTREGYDFTGWYLGDTKYDFNTPVKDDIELLARWQLKVYEVKFIGWQEALLKTQEVKHGKSATAPEIPNITGYTFTGWDKEFTNVTSDLVVTAQYEKKTYTVEFVDWDNKVIKTQNVKFEESATAPAKPTRTGYTFIGWDEDFRSITGDLTVKAQYQIDTYTVTFTGDNINIPEQNVDYNKKANKPTDPTRTGYTFKGWLLDSEEFNFDTLITKDITLKADWEIITYTVVFKDHDGTVLKEDLVNHGEEAVAPANPTRAGHTFTGWDKDFNKVTSDLVITARYSINQYTVRFLDHKGNVIETRVVDYGTSASAPTPPTRTGYTFDKWDKAFNEITADLDVTALYTINKYTVTFNSDGGSAVPAIEVNYNTPVAKPKDPTKDGHTFKGWLLDGSPYEFSSSVTKNITLKASWEIHTFKVTFDSDGGSAVKQATVNYNTTVTEPTNPTKTGYTFTGWFLGDNEFNFSTKITSNITLKAHWSKVTYNINYQLEGGTWKWSEKTVSDPSKGIAPYSKLPEEFMEDFFTFLKDNNLLNSPLVHTKVRASNWFEFSTLQTDPKALYNNTSSPGMSGQNDGYSQHFFDTAEGNKTTGLFTKVNGGFFGTEPYKSKYEGLLNHVALLGHHHGGTHYTNTRFWEKGEEENNHLGKSLFGFILDAYFYGTQGLSGRGDGYVALRGKIANTDKYYEYKGGKAVVVNLTLPKTTYQITDSFKLQAPVRTGYFFKGWYTAKTGGSKITEIKGSDTGNKTFYARWEETPKPTGKLWITTRFDTSTEIGHTTSGDDANRIFIYDNEELRDAISTSICEITSSNPDILDVSSYGTIFAKKVGTVTVTVKYGNLVGTIKLSAIEPASKTCDTFDQVKKEFLTDFYNYLGKPGGNINTFMHGAGKTSGYAGTWYSTHKAKIYAGPKPTSVNNAYFASSSAYMDKWLPFFNLMDTLVTETNPDQSFWDDGAKTYTGLLRLDELMRGARYSDKGKVFTDLKIPRTH